MTRITASRISFCLILALLVAATVACQPPASAPPEPKARSMQAASTRTYASRGDGTSRIGNSRDVVTVEGEPFDLPREGDPQPYIDPRTGNPTAGRRGRERRRPDKDDEAFAAVAAAASEPDEAKPSESKPDDSAPAADKGSSAPDANKPADSTDKPPTAGAPTDAASTAAAAADSATQSKRVLLGTPELTAGIPGSGALTLTDIQKWLTNPTVHEILEVELPLGLAAGAGQITGLDKNPLTHAKIELGRQLYFDTRLSADESVSCASCHDPDEGYTRHSRFGIGIRQLAGGRNSPVSYNRILSASQFWDGRADSLEDQAVGPIANAIEMGNTHEACVACLKRVPGYRAQFEKIFGKLDIHTVGMALASFERAIVTGPSPFDYNEIFRLFKDQDPEDLKEDPELMAKYEKALEGTKSHPMSDSAKRGRDLFFSEKANCTACHVGANLADEKYHNIGIGMDKEKPDPGRAVFSMQDKDRGAFKTPTIRNVELSAPYMHDGSVATLEEVVEWYAKGGHPNRSLSDKIKKLNLSAQDKTDLVEFMKACTGDFPKVERGRLPK